MRSIALAVALICLCVPTGKCSDSGNGKINRLRLLAFPRVSMDGARRGTDGTLIISVYLENVARSSVRVITGEKLELAITAPLASYFGMLEHTPDGRAVKPTPGRLDVVDLRPGEMAELKTIIVPLERTVDTYRIVYDVDESLASEGNCWGRSDGGRSDGVMCEFSTKPIKEETGGLTARWADTGSRGWRGSCGSSTPVPAIT
jgi:hypothetical protein